jgi:hypothetical protein
MTITQTSVPEQSRLHATAQQAYFCDTYTMPMEGQAGSALALTLHVLARTPRWIDALMKLRNRMVALVGLKNVGALSNIDPVKPADSYRVGDNVGAFSIVSLDENEVVLGDSDKHLDAQVSFCKYHDSEPRMAITTSVQVHNLLGRIYLLFVVPVHKLIVPAMLRVAATSPTS